MFRPVSVGVVRLASEVISMNYLKAKRRELRTCRWYLLAREVLSASEGFTSCTRALYASSVEAHAGQHCAIAETEQKDLPLL